MLARSEHLLPYGIFSILANMSKLNALYFEGVDTALDRAISSFFILTTRCEPLVRGCFKLMCTMDNGAIAKPAEDVHILSGSLSDFNVRPLLPCIADVDIMYRKRTAVVKPTGLPVVPTTSIPVPDYFVDSINVFEMRDTDWTGYVLLLPVGRLTRKLRGDGGGTLCNSFEFFGLVTDTGGFGYKLSAPDDPNAVVTVNLAR